jgi:hypothetical protein
MTRLRGLAADQKGAVVCALVGHSRVQTHFFGEYACGRCGVVVGDSLVGAYNAHGAVILGHGCATCRKNREILTWKDTLLVEEKLAEDA